MPAAASSSAPVQTEATVAPAAWRSAIARGIVAALELGADALRRAVEPAAAGDDDHVGALGQRAVGGDDGAVAGRDGRARPRA